MVAILHPTLLSMEISHIVDDDNDDNDEISCISVTQH